MHLTVKRKLKLCERTSTQNAREDMEVNIHTLRKPRLIILNIPEEISTTKLEYTLLAQNPGLNFKKRDIVDKVSYETKKQIRNLVMELADQTRKLLIQKRIKLGGQISKIEDYLVANRYLKCSRFNHRFRDCRWEVTCKLCAGTHMLREFTADPM
jgi:hypothetical protein